MVEALLNVKFLLVREHQTGQHAIFHEVQKVSTSFDPHSFMGGCELMALLHLVGDGLVVFLRMWLIKIWLILASAASLVAQRRGFVLNFFLVFSTIRLVRTVLFLPWPGRLDVWPVSLNFLTTFQFHAEFEALLQWSSYPHSFYGGLRLFFSIAIEIMLFI